MRSSLAGLFMAGAAISVSITLGAASQDGSTPTPAVTFNKDIAPILWRHCAACHLPGRSGPFSLITYDAVRPRAREIARAVKSRRMPPWKPEPGHGTFAGSRALAAEQVSLIERWVEQGSLEGHPRDLPPPPAWSDGWEMGEPDLVVAMPEPFPMAANATDVFRTFVVPIPLSARRYVRAMEFRPGSPRAVHHANIKVDQTRFSRQWDVRDPGPGYRGGGSREAKFPDGQFLGWTPGQSPRVSPPGMAWRLDPGSDLVIEMHLMSGFAAESVQASVGFFFTDQAPTRTAYMLRLGRQDLDIPAGQREYVSTDAYTLPVNVDVLGIQPHAHFLAREVRGTATLPDGTITPLIYIREWDFHWQDFYQFAAPLALPRGTVVAMRYTYDNSAGNTRNPSRPPRRVTFGQTSASEMGTLWLQVLPGSPAAWQTLDRHFSPKLLADDIAGNEKWLEVNPEDAQIHAELGMCYFEADRSADALRHLSEAARLDPVAGRHYDVGRLLLVMRLYQDAVMPFRRALALEPGMAASHYGLGLAFDGQGRLDEAVAAYTTALELNLDYADAHFNLARVLTVQGRYGEAVAHYRRALQLNPGDAETLAAIERLAPVTK